MGPRLLATLCSAFVGLAGVSCGAPAPPPPVQHIVVVTLDTQRADVIGAYGSPAGHTPNLDRIAGDAALFEHAVTPIGTTVPAHLSLFSGLYPRRHGVLSNEVPAPRQLATVAASLRAGGFATAAFVSRRFVANAAVGFETADHPVDQPADQVSAALVERAIAWRRAQATPTFLWIHLFDAHSPYTLRDYARSAFQRSGYTGPLSDGASVEEFHALERAPDAGQDLAAARVLYEGEVRHGDALVGRLWDALGAGADGDLFVITADHGQLLGEHGEVGHAYRLWEPVLRVPLMITGPGVAPRRISQTVGLIDLAPTLLELAGRPALPGIDGRSLVPLLRGGALPDRLHFAGSRSQQGRPPARHARAADTVVVYSGGEKAWLAGDDLSVFDLGSDPGEERPGSLSAPARARLQAEAGAHRALAAIPAPSRPASVDREVLEELRALGYAE